MDTLFENTHCDNFEHSQTAMGAMDVIPKTFFERIFLVPGLIPCEPRVKFPFAPTSAQFASQLFLDFCEIVLPNGGNF